MQKKILFIFLVSCCHLVYGQSVIKGDVKDKNGQMIKGASITVKNSYDGAVTDEKGIFSFSISASGTVTIEAEAMGYITQSVQLDSQKVSSNPLILHFCLMETMNQLDAVTVTVSAFGGGQGKKGVVVLSALDVLTTAGANADISKAVNLLPGAQQISNEEGLFVRGGTGYETKQFIDGSLVPHPYYLGADNIPGRGRYSATLFKGFSFNTGGYSALYGQALSSVLTMETIDMPERSEANAFISPIQNSLGFQSLSENKKFSWGMNYQYTNVGLYYKLVKQAARYFKYPEFHNAEANFRVKTKRGILKFYSSFSYNGLGLARPGVDSVNTYIANSIEDFNWWNNLQWKTVLGKGWQLRFNAAFSFNRSHIVAQLQDKNAKPVSTGAAWIDTLNFRLKSKQGLAQSKYVIEKRWGPAATLRFGSEYWQSTSQQSYRGLYGRLRDDNFSSFVESEIYLSGALMATIGMRYEYSKILKESDLAPRVAVAYKVGKNASVSAAYGIFFQKPEDNWLMYHTGLTAMKASHYILSYQLQKTGKFLRMEAFYKNYDRLVKTWPSVNNDGFGYAKGAELYWRDKTLWKDFDYTISYSFLDTKRDYLNFPEELNPDFAAKHTLSIGIKKFFTKIGTGLSLTNSFATGRPYYNFLLNDRQQYYIADAGQTAGYETIDVSLYHLTKIGKASAIWYVSATNLLGKQNVSGYTYSFDGQTRQAVMPIAKRFYFIGLMLNWGVDRRQNAIDNL